MQAIFAVITVLITLITGGFVPATDTDFSPDRERTTYSSQAEGESDGGPEADPIG